MKFSTSTIRLSRWSARFFVLGLLGALLQGLFFAATVSAFDDTARFETLYEAGKFPEAEAFAKQVLATTTDGNSRGTWLHNLGMAYDGAGKYREAEGAYRESYAALIKVLGANHANIALSRSNLANTLTHLGRYGDADAAYQESIRIRERLNGADSPVLIQDLIGLGGLKYQIGDYAESEKLFQRSLRVLQKSVGNEHAVVALVMTNLGSLYQTQGKFEEAETTIRAALKMREKVQGTDHPDIGQTLNNLATLEIERGRYADAEIHLKRALELQRRKLGPDHPDTVTSLTNLGSFYESQRRSADAEATFRECLAQWTKLVGAEDSKVSNVQLSLASLYRRQNRAAEASAIFEKTVPLLERQLGADHPDVARALTNWSICEALQKHFDVAADQQQRAVRIFESRFGADWPNLALILKTMAATYMIQERNDLAEPLLERAIRIGETRPSSRESLNASYILRAEIRWESGRKTEALEDAKRSIDLLEEQYGLTSGTEFDRAQALSGSFDPFTNAAFWQAESGNLAESFSTLERGRARTLSEQMRVSGADLLNGVAPDVAAKLKQRELQTRVRLTSLQHRANALSERQDLSEQQRRDESKRLDADITAAQSAYLEVYREIRNVSPAHRLAIAEGSRPLSWDALQTWVVDQKAVFLEFQIGEETSFVLVVNPDRTVAAHKLVVNDDLAKVLGVEPGALTNERLTAALTDKGTALVRRFNTEPPTAQVLQRLSALWRVLIPEPVREVLLSGKAERMIVIPSGPLTMLPLEVLVVELGEQPRYLLDVAPPIVYAPSANVAHNLARRAVVPTPKDLKPVLTVGDPIYGTGTRLPTSATSSTDLVTSRARYSTVGGRLARLPFSATESTWVADAFQRDGIAAGVLKQQDATEAKVTYNMPGRKVVHIATHGLVDQAHGNLFGALAFTPGPQAASNPADDGFLTLAEIYQQNLRGMELVILSACDTNYGPEQQGEGVWSLSRGFLVAGSRRVVASNWLVDDEAAASLVSYYCAALSQAEKNGETPDYAQALHRAKKWARQQDKWQSPYFWGTFVLVGPN